MIQDLITELSDNVNQNLDVVAVLNHIGYEAEKTQTSGSTIKAFCCIHKDNRFRSLLLDTDKKTFKCTLKTCAGYSGGSLVRLLALASDRHPLAAVKIACNDLNAAPHPDWEKEILAALNTYAEEAQAANNLNEVEKALQAVAELDSSNSQSRLRIAELCLLRGDTTEAQELFVSIAEQELEAGNTDLAEQSVLKAMELLPGNEDLMFLFVRCAEQRKDSPAVIKRLNDIVLSREGTDRAVDNFGVLQKILEYSPDSIEHRLKLAAHFESRHDLRKAGQEFEKAAKSYLAAEKKIEAIDLLEKVIRYEPEMVKVRLQLADLLREADRLEEARDHTFAVINGQIDQQDYGSALSTINKWLEIEPKNIEGRELIARIYQEQERNEESVTVLQEAARIAEEEGQSERAVEILLRSKFLLPESREIRQNLIRVFNAQQEYSRAAFEIIDLAEFCFTRHQIDEGCNLLLSCAETPLPIALKCQIAESLKQYGRAAEAKQILDDAVNLPDQDISPDDRVQLYQSAVHVSDAGLEESARLLQFVQEHLPEQTLEITVNTMAAAKTHGTLLELQPYTAKTAEQITDYSPLAARFVELAIDQNDLDTAGAVYQNIISQLAEINPESALKIARKIADLIPNHPSALSDCAFLFNATGKPEEASRYFARLSYNLFLQSDSDNSFAYAEEAVNAHPQNTYAHLLRAQIIATVSPEQLDQYLDNLFEESHQCNDASLLVEIYNFYFDQRPDDTDARQKVAERFIKLGLFNDGATHYFELASRLKDSGNTAQAAEFAKSSLSYSPDDANALRLYAEILEQTGDNAAASEYYSRAASGLQNTDSALAESTARHALTLDPQNKHALDILLRIYEDQDKVDEAAAICRQIIAIPGTALDKSENIYFHEKLSRLQPDDHHVWSPLASLYRTADPEKFFAAVEKAFTLLTAKEHWDEALDLLQTKFADQALSESLAHELNKLIPNLPQKTKTAYIFFMAENYSRAKQPEKAASVLSEYDSLINGENLRLAATWESLAAQQADKAEEARCWLKAAEYAANTENGKARELDSIRKASLALPFDTELLKRYASESQNHPSPETKESLASHFLTLLFLHLEEESASWQLIFFMLEKLPDLSADTLYRAGKILYNHGKKDDALTALEKAAQKFEQAEAYNYVLEICDLDPELTSSAIVLTKLRAQALFVLKEKIEAVEWLKQNAQEFASQGKYAEAADLAGKWAEQSPEDPVVLEFLADLYTKAGNPASAVESLLKLSNYYIKDKDFREAAAVAESARALTPERFEIYPLLIKSYDELSDSENRSRAEFAWAYAYADSGDSTAALDKLEAALEKAPGSSEDRELLARLVREVYGDEESLPYTRKWLTLIAENEQPEKIFAAYRSALETYPNDYGLTANYVALLRKHGHLDKDPTPLHPLSLLAEKNGDRENAAAALEEYGELTSALTGQDYERLGGLWLQIGKTSKAVSAWRQAAFIFIEEADFPAAFSATSNILEYSEDSLNPTDYIFHAKALKGAGKTADALAAYSDALNLLGGAGQDIRKKRRILLEEALEIDPLNADFLALLINQLPVQDAIHRAKDAADELEKQGRDLEVRKILEAATALDPFDFDLRKRLIQNLQTTESRELLRQELSSFISDAFSCDDKATCDYVVKELTLIAESPADHIAIAKLCEQINDPVFAAEHYTSAAEQYTAQNKPELAVSTLQKAAALNPAAVSPATIASMVEHIGPLVYDVAYQQLRVALTARNLTHVLTISKALLDRLPHEEYAAFFKNVAKYGNSGFCVAIAKDYSASFSPSNGKDKPIALMQTLQKVAGENPDAWTIVSDLAKSCGFYGDAKQASLQAAQLYHQIGAISEEENCLLTILNDSPDDPQVREILAHFYLRENDQEKARGILQPAINMPDSQLDQTVARRIFKLLIDLEDDTPEILTRYAGSLELSNPENAVNAWFRVAAKYEELNRLNAAAETYTHIRQLSPRNLPALKALWNLAINSENAEKIFDATLELSQLLLDDNKPLEAVRYIKDAVSYDPANFRLLHLLSDAAIQANDIETLSSVTHTIGQLYLQADNKIAAANQFEMLLRFQPNNITVINTIIDCLPASENPTRVLSFANRLYDTALLANDIDSIYRAAVKLVELDSDNPVSYLRLAQSQLSLNMVKEAIVRYNEAGEIYESRELYTQALECYYKITKLAPDSLTNWRKIANIACHQGNHDLHFESVRLILDKQIQFGNKEEALSLVTEILDIPLADRNEARRIALDAYKFFDVKDKQLEFHLSLLRQAIKSGNINEANNHIRSVTALDANLPELMTLRLDLARHLGNQSEVVHFLTQAADKDFENGNYDSAINNLTELISLTANPVETRRTLISVLEKSARPEEASAHKIILISELLAHKEYEEARHLTDSLLSGSSDPETVRPDLAEVFNQFGYGDMAARLYLTQAEYFQRRGEYAHEILYIQLALQAKPHWIEALEHGAKSSLNNDVADYTQFALPLIRVLADEQRYREASVHLPTLLAQQNLPPDTLSIAADIYEKLLDVENETALRWKLVKHYQSTGDNTEAARNCSRLSILNPEDPEVQSQYIEILSLLGNKAELSREYMRLADMLAKKGDTLTATQTYEQAMALDDNATGIRARFATFLVSKGDNVRAVAEMRRLADQYIAHRELQLAVDVLNAAIALSPNDAHLCLTLASVQEALGRSEEARISYARATSILSETAASKGIDTYKRLLLKEPNNTGVRMRLLQILIASGDISSARIEARKLVEIHIAKKEIDEAEKVFSLISQHSAETAHEIREAVHRDANNPTMQYLHLIRLGDKLFETGDVDGALNTYRTARTLKDDRISLIKKCIDCIVLIAPEQEAIPDYLAIAERHILKNEFEAARKTYEIVRAIDPFNADAKMGIAATNSAERQASGEEGPSDSLPLKSPGKSSKGIDLQELLAACKDATVEEP